MWTAFDYMYRDAGNFKAFGSVLLKGSVSEADQAMVESRLSGGEFFIAEQIGVPPLYAELYRWSEGPTESDHCWHEFAGFRELTEPPTDTSAALRATDFVARFAALNAWNEDLSPHFCW
jgi:hypothetical protein